jgi:hypothetical protein
VFDDDTEASITESFKTNYIEPRIGGTRQALGSLCLNSDSSTQPDEFRRNRFCALSRFLRGLEKRHGLTMRKPHTEKRTGIDEAYARYVCDRMNALCRDYPPKLVFNLDETYWYLFEALEGFWKKKGRRR